MSIVRTAWTSTSPKLGAGPLVLVVGEALSVRIFVKDKNGLPVDLTGLVDASSRLNTSTGASITTPTVTVDDLTAGALLVAITTTATASAQVNARLSIALNFGTSRDETCQPIPVGIITR